MRDNNFRDFISKTKKEYKNIGYIKCPAFRNENIYFNRHGFNHLIRKERKLRDRKE